jgi:polar amino acid transport system substrate-binding protein
MPSFAASLIRVSCSGNSILQCLCSFVFLPCLVLGLSVQALAAPVKISATLDAARNRGTLVVGIKTDYPPFGQLDAKGLAEGLEHDLALDIAQRIGVGLVKVPVTGANRLQKLEEGTVDVIIATMGDTADRRRIAALIEPNYYSSGVTLLMRPEQKAKDWIDIRGLKVCAIQGSYFNRPMSQRYLLDLVIFNNARDAKLALRDGQCKGYLFDNTAIQSDLARPEWAGYSAPLAPAMVAPWAIAVAKRDQGTELERVLSDAVADWHRTGFLLAREKAWNLPETKFLQDAQKLWTSTEDKRLVCSRDSDGQWPAACRNPVFVTSGDVGGLRGLGLLVRELTGMDLTLVYDDYDRLRFFKGLLQSLALILLCVLGSLAVGVLAALLAESRWKVLGKAVRLLCIYGRMTPPLLQMYMLFFGLGALAWSAFSVSLSPLLIAVWCLSYYTGSSIMNALLDSANHAREQRPDFALSLSSIRGVVDVSSGPVTAALVNVSKATMMASAISVPELLSAATAIMSDNGNVAVMMNALLLVFLLLIAATYRLLAWAAKRLHKQEVS